MDDKTHQSGGQGPSAQLNCHGWVGCAADCYLTGRRDRQGLSVSRASAPALLVHWRPWSRPSKELAVDKRPRSPRTYSTQLQHHCIEAALSASSNRNEAGDQRGSDEAIAGYSVRLTIRLFRALHWATMTLMVYECWAGGSPAI